MNKIAIIDSAFSARQFLKRNIRASSWKIYSTHYGALDYLKSINIDCHDLSEFLSTNDIIEGLKTASLKLKAIVNELDEIIGKKLCMTAGWPEMEIFFPLYKHRAQFKYAGYMAFEKVIRDLLQNNNIERLEYYVSLESSKDSVFSLVQLAKEISKNNKIDFQLFTYDETLENKSKINARRILNIFKYSKIFDSKFISYKIFTLYEKLCSRTIQPKKHNTYGLILISYKKQTADIFKHYGIKPVYLYPDNICRFNGVNRSVLDEKIHLMKNKLKLLLKSYKPQNKLIHSLIIKDLITHISDYILPTMFYSSFVQKFSVGMVAWDNPVCNRPPLNLLTEYFLSLQTPVLGRQHGGCYVSQNTGFKHFDSDFNRCTHFLSYGIGNKEFKETYPGQNLPCQFLPIGNKQTIPKKNAEDIDILFPIVNSIELAEHGRLPESILVNRQERILEGIMQRTDLNSVIKPFANYSERNFAWYHRLKSLNNLNISKIPLNDFLENYKPKLVVLEYTSTSLYDVINLDLDIFLMVDDVFPISNSAMILLQKRAHIFSNSNDIKKAIITYNHNTVHKLRDDSFYKTYVNRGSISDLMSIDLMDLKKDCSYKLN